MSRLVATGAGLSYIDQGKAVDAVAEIDLTVEPGEFLGILGPSGSGKSSLLYLLSGLKSPTRGEIRYDDRSYADLNDARKADLRMREFGFVFQQPYLLGYLSAIENVLTVAQATEARAAELLEDLGMGEKAHRMPHELSGGERQRVCVARALAGEPKIVFADEPTAALDHRNGSAVVSLLAELRGRGSLVMVTHDPSMLERADRIVRIVEGRLITGSEASA